MPNYLQLGPFTFSWALLLLFGGWWLGSSLQERLSHVVRLRKSLPNGTLAARKTGSSQESTSHGSQDGRTRLRKLHQHLRLRSRMPEKHKTQQHRTHEPRVPLCEDLLRRINDVVEHTKTRGTAPKKAVPLFISPFRNDRTALCFHENPKKQKPHNHSANTTPATHSHSFASTIRMKFRTFALVEFNHSIPTIFL